MTSLNQLHSHIVVNAYTNKDSSHEWTHKFCFGIVKGNIPINMSLCDKLLSKFITNYIYRFKINMS
jgi:hypothetical protein